MGFALLWSSDAIPEIRGPALRVTLAPRMASPLQEPLHRIWGHHAGL